MKKVFKKKIVFPSENESSVKDDQDWKELMQYIKSLFSALPKEEQIDMKEE